MDEALIWLSQPRKPPRVRSIPNRPCPKHFFLYNDLPSELRSQILLHVFSHSAVPPRVYNETGNRIYRLDHHNPSTDSNFNAPPAWLITIYTLPDLIVSQSFLTDVVPIIAQSCMIEFSYGASDKTDQSLMPCHDLGLHTRHFLQRLLPFISRLQLLLEPVKLAIIPKLKATFPALRIVSVPSSARNDIVWCQADGSEEEWCYYERIWGSTAKRQVIDEARQAALLGVRKHECLERLQRVVQAWVQRDGRLAKVRADMQRLTTDHDMGGGRLVVQTSVIVRMRLQKIHIEEDESGRRRRQRKSESDVTYDLMIDLVTFHIRHAARR